jgi:hypothetical protein
LQAVKVWIPYVISSVSVLPASNKILIAALVVLSFIAKSFLDKLEEMREEAENLRREFVAEMERMRRTGDEIVEEVAGMRKEIVAEMKARRTGAPRVF